ncbi:MAG TPA: DUF86 domain-containing protein [Bacteroidia bacterium]|nr:DUF86 domain-containing protein [Bacteroidia bacterium]
MIPSEKDRALHIINAIDRISHFTLNTDEFAFMENEMLRDAVLYQFIIIGEAILYIEKEKLSRYSYPWHLVRRFRNYIAHEYFGINMKMVWETIVRDLPKLKIAVEEVLQKEF